MNVPTSRKERAGRTTRGMRRTTLAKGPGDRPSGYPSRVPAHAQIDVFEKARSHERLAILQAAREADMVPYFRVMESPAKPIVEMEGRSRIMLGGNNYLGLTEDQRVIDGARHALEQYGTGMTGSRLLNGTTRMHLELEAEIAEWMGAEDAIVFTTGNQANVGTLGTIIGPG